MSKATQLAEPLSQYGAYCGVIHEQGTKSYKYNHVQVEKLHEGSPQMNWVFEFMRHKRSLDKEIFYKQLFFQKSIMLGQTEQNLKLKVFEHESDLAG